jgi:hypothetical protein
MVQTWIVHDYRLAIGTICRHPLLVVGIPRCKTTCRFRSSQIAITEVPHQSTLRTKARLFRGTPTTSKINY